MVEHIKKTAGAHVVRKVKEKDKVSSRNEAKSLVSIMTAEEIEKKFIPELQLVSAGLFSILKTLSVKEFQPDREMCFLLSKEVDRVETFLDDYGATNNRRFFFFRELVASIRWIDVAIFQAVHILARFDNYSLALNSTERKQFISELRGALNFYISGLTQLAMALQDEARNLELVPGEAPYEGKIGFGLEKKMLPADLGQEAIRNEQEVIIEILKKFLEVAEDFSLYVNTIRALADISEESLENFRSAFNRIQSLYDSYLKNTRAENELPDLKKIRGHVSVPLHLLEIGRALMHFYERHSDRIRSDAFSVKIAHLVDKTQIRDNVKDFVLKQALVFVEIGKRVSGQIFRSIGSDPDEYILETRGLVLPAYRVEDFHIRPIMPLTQIAGKYGTDSYLFFNRSKYNLKSPIELAIAIPDIRETLAEENAALMLRGPRKAVVEMANFLSEKCGAYEKTITRELLETQSARLDRSGRKV